MQVVPLLSDLEDERFVSPTQALVSTTGYGKLVFRNPTPWLLLVPCHAGYVVKESVQDHAMSHAAFVPAQAHKRFDTAVCIQATQPGLIREGSYRMMVLPYALRESALAVRRKEKYDRLWPAISALNREIGLPDQGDLAIFLRRFQRELDQFVAEFECVPEQVGAIVLIAGRVVGVERCPSRAYFASVWDALLRECYGSQAVRMAQQSAQPEVPTTRVPLRSEIDSLDDLARALDEARAAEDEAARDQVRALLDLPFRVEVEDELDDLRLETLRNDQLVGQIVRAGQRVCYASLVTARSWARQQEWREAPPFEL
jgi:hypothetical protein